MTVALICLVCVVIVLAVGLVLTNVVWLKHVRFLTNAAIARSPSEFAVRQSTSDRKENADEKPHVKRIRPDGI
jgi:hypothetical protein